MNKRKATLQVSHDFSIEDAAVAYWVDIALPGGTFLDVMNGIATAHRWLHALRAH